MLVREPFPALCEFPIYTRSGEVFVDTVHLNECVVLRPEEKELIMTFHKYTFTTVLRFDQHSKLASGTSHYRTLSCFFLHKSDVLKALSK